MPCSPQWQSQLALKGHCHTSTPALSLSEIRLCFQTISWKHLRPQGNGVKIQVPLHVTCVLKQANSLILPRQGQSSGASCWQCCMSYERSPEEQTPSATALLFQPKQLLLFFQGWVAFLRLFPPAKCWRALKCHTSTVLSAAPFCVLRKPGRDMLKGAKNTPQTCGDNTACAHNRECLQACCEECLALVGKGGKKVFLLYLSLYSQESWLMLL